MQEMVGLRAPVKVMVPLLCTSEAEPLKLIPPVIVHSVEGAFKVPELIVTVPLAAVAGSEIFPAVTVMAPTVKGEYEAKLSE